MKNLKSNEQRSKNVIILIWIVLAIEIASLISMYFQYEILLTTANGGYISFETAALTSIMQILIEIIYLIVYIISGIAFIKWLRRAYYNLHTKINNLSHSDGWAAGCWFVPIVCLYMPFQILKELYQKTHALLAARIENYDGKISSSLVVWWWVLWILNSIIGQFTSPNVMKAGTIDQLTNMTIVSIISSLVAIPLALVTIKMIKDYSSVEPLLYNLQDDYLPETITTTTNNNRWLSPLGFMEIKVPGNM